MYLPLCEVADIPFIFKADDLRSATLSLLLHYKVESLRQAALGLLPGHKGGQNDQSFNYTAERSRPDRH